MFSQSWALLTQTFGFFFQSVSKYAKKGFGDFFFKFKSENYKFLFSLYSKMGYVPPHVFAYIDFLKEKIIELEKRKATLTEKRLREQTRKIQRLQSIRANVLIANCHCPNS